MMVPHTSLLAFRLYDLTFWVFTREFLIGEISFWCGEGRSFSLASILISDASSLYPWFCPIFYLEFFLNINPHLYLHNANVAFRSVPDVTFTFTNLCT
ncbi:hypothetical protein PILCRDRAFT_532473 [Piloderma croceum F 1598]|uniref:Uncharacterized protein n=1 Tax=Piloderma croceum (strain F 1598) TaxID=765440 RepID=A0A0C3BSS8_PILCF|nr:hypothetical protein PILCRDRAFT_532473 [Piloderma croceum F 1598]